MPQLLNIEAAQKSLEESFTKRMEELEAQLQSAGNAKDTVAKVAEEFRTFREIIYSMLGLLRRQISECSKAVDAMETRHRCKSLLFMGVPESEGEDSGKIIADIIQNKLQMKGHSAEAFTICHRLGAPKNENNRPILVRFRSTEFRNSVWRMKTALKGSSVSLREFLTKARQTAFTKARLHFGARACWTQNGNIIVKAPDGTRHKVYSMDDLSPLIGKYPSAPDAAASQARSGAKRAASPGSHKNIMGKV